MIMLSNCNHTKENVVPRIIDQLEKHGYPETDKISQVVLHLIYKVTWEILFLSKHNSEHGFLEPDPVH